VKVFYSDAYVQAAHEFDTVRKSSWIAESLRDDPIPGVVIVKPEPVSAATLAGVHDPAYVDAVRTGYPRHLAESQGFAWDPGMWASVTASNGGTVAAALAALDDGVAGSLSSGLHHARRGEGRGGCTFNGLALAAHAVTSRRPGEVLIVDFDAHCGGGTASLIQNSERIRQLDVAVNGFDHYAADPGKATLDVVHSGDRYLDAIQGLLTSWTPEAPAA
jgi:acetoin utilization deacetylase AcuC-like enzyme